MGFLIITINNYASKRVKTAVLLQRPVAQPSGALLLLLGNYKILYFS